MADEGAENVQEKWDSSIELRLEEGVTFVESDAVRRWLDRIDPALAKKWDATVDHAVRTGIEELQRERTWWRPW